MNDLSIETLEALYDQVGVTVEINNGEITDMSIE